MFSRWSDDILEGFLFSTLVDGSGLVLDKLDSDGKGKKSGVSHENSLEEGDQRNCCRERYIQNQCSRLQVPKLTSYFLTGLL